MFAEKSGEKITLLIQGDRQSFIIKFSEILI